jgi:hypothetical protein
MMAREKQEVWIFWILDTHAALFSRGKGAIPRAGNHRRHEYIHPHVDLL